MKFYTGINSTVLFNKIFRLIQPFLSDLIYWKGPKHTKSFSKVRHRRCNTPKKLSQRDEFLLTMICLRLALLNEDWAETFGVSPTHWSYVFTTWINFLGKVLGKTSVVWPPKESIRDWREHLPEIFLKSGYGKFRVIIDCAEVFTERPKSLSSQAATWSDYKHHSTFEFLVGITPNGFVSFLSSCYGGRASDKFFTRDSRFYEVMAGRVFKFKKICFFIFADWLFHLVQEWKAEVWV